MQVRITTEHAATNRAAEGTFEVIDGRRVRKVGLLIDGPDSWKLVAAGVAEPADDECKARFTPEQVAHCQAVGHPALVRLHAEAVAQRRDDASVASFVEGTEDDE